MKYLEIWEKIFNSDYKDSCKNILHIVALLLITPTTNAKLEQMLSQMNRIKTDWQNRLSREHLECNLCIGEEGPTSKDFNPEASISKWYSQKVRRISAVSSNLSGGVVQPGNLGRCCKPSPVVSRGETQDIFMLFCILNSSKHCCLGSVTRNVYKSLHQKSTLLSVRGFEFGTPNRYTSFKIALDMALRIDTAKPHKYPEKWRKLEQSSTSVNVVTYCLSDFETDSGEEQWTFSKCFLLP